MKFLTTSYFRVKKQFFWVHIIIQNRSFTNRYTKQIKKLEKTGAVSSERIARRKLSVNSETILPVNWKFENLIFKMIEHKW